MAEVEATPVKFTIVNPEALYEPAKIQSVIVYLLAMHRLKKQAIQNRLKHWVKAQPYLSLSDTANRNLDYADVQRLSCRKRHYQHRDLFNYLRSQPV